LKINQERTESKNLTGYRQVFLLQGRQRGIKAQGRRIKNLGLLKYTLATNQQEVA